MNLENQAISTKPSERIAARVIELRRWRELAALDTHGPLSHRTLQITQAALAKLAEHAPSEADRDAICEALERVDCILGFGVRSEAQGAVYRHDDLGRLVPCIVLDIDVRESAQPYGACCELGTCELCNDCKPEAQS